MEGWYDGFGGGGGGRISADNEDLQEEDVWGAVMTSKESSSNSNTKTRKNLSSVSPSSAWRLTTTPRAIPKSNYGGSGGHQGLPATHQSSAPVDIPDWSKILKKKTKKKLWDDADEEDYDDDDMVPPHEYLARRVAATQIASFSMCEGVGRTLKGRDLSKLRNTILTKTGFLE